jgi:hypothetical protein
VLWNHDASVPGSNEPPGNEMHGAQRLITVADWLAWVWEVRPDRGSVVRPLRGVRSTNRDGTEKREGGAVICQPETKVSMWFLAGGSSPGQRRRLFLKSLAPVMETMGSAVEAGAGQLNSRLKGPEDGLKHLFGGIRPVWMRMREGLHGEGRSTRRG